MCAGLGYKEAVRRRLLPISLALLGPAAALLGLTLEPGWALPAAAGGLVLAVWLLRPRSVGLVVLAALLSAVATEVGARGRNVLDASAELVERTWPRIDLTERPFPDAAPDFVEVRGHLRTAWRLDEYAVPEGEVPNQNEAAPVSLVALTHGPGQVLELRGPVVIARLSAERAHRPEGMVTLRGRVGPVPDAVLRAVVQAGQGGAQRALRGVLLDTLAVPDRREGWTQVAVAALCAALGALCAFMAFAPATGRAQPRVGEEEARES